MFRKLALLSLIVLVAACTSVEEILPDGITAINPAKNLTEVELINQDNEPMSLNDLQGRYVLLSFGYTHCPDVCPITLAEMRRVHDLLAEQNKAEAVQLVFISVDGKRDTPDILKQHLAYFNADLIGLTTESRELVTDLITQFGGTFNINDVAGAIENYTVDHTAGTFLLDPSGAWVRRYAYRTDPKLIAEDLLNRLKI